MIPQGPISIYCKDLLFDIQAKRELIIPPLNVVLIDLSLDHNPTKTIFEV